MNASPRRQRLIYESILLALAADLVPLRPDRSEPRAVKRRPKVYQLLTKPRRHMVVILFSRPQKVTIMPLYTKVR